MGVEKKPPTRSTAAFHGPDAVLISSARHTTLVLWLQQGQEDRECGRRQGWECGWGPDWGWAWRARSTHWSQTACVLTFYSSRMNGLTGQSRRCAVLCDELPSTETLTLPAARSAGCWYPTAVSQSPVFPGRAMRFQLSTPLHLLLFLWHISSTSFSRTSLAVSSHHR